MLEKSLTSQSDVIVYDLEDSVAAANKADARHQLANFLKREDIPEPERIAVRVNDITSPVFLEDLTVALQTNNVRTIVLPKIHSAEDLAFVSRNIAAVVCPTVNLVASVESARSLFNVGQIAAWKSETGDQGGVLQSLLFASEDYCADTGIIRTPSRSSLQYARSSMVTAAKAFNLAAIDMVCIDYKDSKYLLEECVDGRQLGFTGKQAIHPGQVATIHSTFVPTDSEILRSARIVHQMEVANQEGKGAFGLDEVMIDAPMLKQANNTLKTARAAGLHIPLL